MGSACRQILKIVYPWPVISFLRPSVGKQYGVGLLRKIFLIFRIACISSKTGSYSTFYEQLTMVCRVLEIPKSLKGVVAEFGCFKGAATFRTLL